MSTLATYVSDGIQTIYTFPFDYLRRDFVTVLVDGQTVGFTLSNTYEITLDAAPTLGDVIIIKRVTDTSQLVDFIDGSVLLANDLNVAALQSLHIAAEALDAAGSSLLLTEDGSYSAGFRRLGDLGDPVENRDAVTKEWAETSMTSQLNTAVSKAAEAAASAAAALTQANASAGSATAASGSASTATTQANLATSEANRATTEADRAEAEAEAAALLAGSANSDALAAASSAGTATTKAGEASTSATAAEAAKVAAEAAAGSNVAAGNIIGRDSAAGTGVVGPLTPAQVKTALDINGGSSVTAPSRTLGVIYTNTTGKPIFVTAAVRTTNGGTGKFATIEARVAGAIVIQNTYETTNNIAGNASVSFIVPTGLTYEVDSTVNNGVTLSQWTEWELGV